jgi:hypothetical protein
MVKFGVSRPRFTACKSVGMDAKNVLQEKEKSHRFRQVIKKRAVTQVNYTGLRKGFATMTFGKQTRLSTEASKELGK